MLWKIGRRQRRSGMEKWCGLEWWNGGWDRKRKMGAEPTAAPEHRGRMRNNWREQEKQKERKKD